MRTDFDALPDSAVLRVAELVRGPKNPAALLPFSTASLWRHVRNGHFPKPVKLSERVTGWRVGDVRAWLSAQHTQPAPECPAVKRRGLGAKGV